MLKKVLIIIAIAAAIFIGARFIRFAEGGPRVRVGNDVFSVELADTVEDQAKGLSGRASLGRNQGMFFLFERPDLYGFWMKGMLFPIDIIWVSGDRVVGITEDLPPAEGASPPLYYPPTLVDRVLEVRAGEVQDRGIAAGDTVELLLR